MSSNITPNLEPTKDLGKFKFWCQKVLPLVYDDAISYYEVLCKVVDYLNTVIDNVNTDADNIDELADDFLELQTYVNNFFADIDQLASYATRAETAANAASASAVTAATQAGNAASSASSAASSASNSASSALTALGAETDAIAAKNAAQSAASAAGTSETNAGNSATAAAGSATAAAGSATDAASSATAAAGSATSAQGYADSADHYKDGANTAALKAEGNAIGKQNGVDVDSESPYYHNNAKYYAEQAAASALNSDGANAQAMIANSESTATASYKHDEGTFFRLNGVLYEATSDIDIGDTITVGTNCKIAVVCDELSQQAKSIENIKNEFSNSLVKNLIEGAYAYFNDGADNIPLEKLIINIEPIQSGSGEPSSENVRPFVPVTEINVEQRRKNLFTSTPIRKITNATVSSSTGEIVSNNYRDVFVYAVPKGILYAYKGTNDIENGNGFSDNPNLVKGAGNAVDDIFYWRWGYTNNHVNSHKYMYAAAQRDASRPIINALTLISNSSTLPVSENVSKKVEFNTTVYCGTLDLINGTLTTRPYYASYNGETLSGRWLSSKDVYSENTTPTIGAEVIDLDGNETEYVIDADNLTTFLEDNSIWADCGDISIEYPTDIKTYIDNKIKYVELMLTANRETNMIATKNYSTGNLIIVQEKIYKATTSISNGATLTVGTNISVTTIAAEIAAL